MKPGIKEKRKFRRSDAWLFSACAAWGMITAILITWFPPRTKPWHPDFAEIVPRWMLWMKVHEVEWLQTCMFVMTVMMACMAAQAFGERE